MLVQSFLVQGDGAAVASHMASWTTASPVEKMDALVLFSLGADHPRLLHTLRQNRVECPVYLTETYGILGYDIDSERNIELMEKGRGSEYGFCGGSGGQGCLVARFSGVQAGHCSDFPIDASSLMVIADQSGKWDSDRAKAPVHCGGITKSCWKVIGNEMLESVPYFWIANVSKEPVGISTFTGDAAEATSVLLEKMPPGHNESGVVGLFPCFTRGVNQYGAENVESEAIIVAMSQAHIKKSPRIYGMFAHGELGPIQFGGFIAEPNNIACAQHSLTSILSIHTIGLN